MIRTKNKKQCSIKYIKLLCSYKTSAENDSVIISAVHTKLLLHDIPKVSGRVIDIFRSKTRKKQTQCGGIIYG